MKETLHNLFFGSDLLWGLAHHAEKNSAQVGGRRTPQMLCYILHGPVGVTQQLGGSTATENVFILNGGVSRDRFESAVEAGLAHAAKTGEGRHIEF